MLSNVQNDPEERKDLSREYEEKVEELKDRVMEYFEDLIPRFADQDDNVSNLTRFLQSYLLKRCKCFSNKLDNFKREKDAFLT
jgi:hypothetical protein